MNAANCPSAWGLVTLRSALEPMSKRSGTNSDWKRPLTMITEAACGHHEFPADRPLLKKLRQLLNCLGAEQNEDHRHRRTRDPAGVRRLDRLPVEPLLRPLAAHHIRGADRRGPGRPRRERAYRAQGSHRSVHRHQPLRLDGRRDLPGSGHSDVRPDGQGRRRPGLQAESARSTAPGSRSAAGPCRRTRSAWPRPSNSTPATDTPGSSTTCPRSRTSSTRPRRCRRWPRRDSAYTTTSPCTAPTITCPTCSSACRSTKSPAASKTRCPPVTSTAISICENAAGCRSSCITFRWGRRTRFSASLPTPACSAMPTSATPSARRGCSPPATAPSCCRTSGATSRGR